MIEHNTHIFGGLQQGLISRLAKWLIAPRINQTGKHNEVDAAYCHDKVYQTFTETAKREETSSSPRVLGIVRL